MILKILGAVDLFAAAWLLLLHYGMDGYRVGLMIGLWLVLKGFIFKGSWTSYIDMLAGIYMLFSLFSTHWFLTYVFAIYLGQKAFFSLFV
jgi:uncharacterized membrane protein HdeD (DUF308 family)